MSLFVTLDINASGLTAQRRRLDVADSNIVNSTTTRTDAGGPYRRKDVVFQAMTFGGAMAEADGRLEGVEVAGVIDDMTPFDVRYEPGHPDAVNDYVSYPNVNLTQEMMNFMSASRSYDANLAAISIVKTMILRTLEIGR